MNILLYSIHGSPELTGVGKYNGEMLEYLSNEFENIYAVAPPPYYPEWKVHKGYNSYSYTKEKQGNLTHIRCPILVPSRMTLLKRIIYLMSFSISSSFALLSLFRKKIDVVIVTQPTLFCVPAALIFARFKKCKTVLHIQDFEVDAMLGLNIMKDNWLTKCVAKFESFLMRRFDLVTSISYNMLDKVTEKGVSEQRFTLFPNWSDTEFVTPSTCGKQLKAEWGFSETDKIILYAGNIGKKQGLEVLLDTAKYYANEPHIKFVLVGTGIYVKKLRGLVEQQGISNIFFKPLEPWKRVPEMLALADMHLVVQKKGAADVLLPSKLTNILSAGGHAIVTAEPNTELGQIAQKFPGIYACIEPESANALILAINKLLARDLTMHNNVARQYAEMYLAKEKILGQFSMDLKNLVEPEWEAATKEQF